MIGLVIVKKDDRRMYVNDTREEIISEKRRFKENILSVTVWVFVSGAGDSAVFCH